MFNAKQPKLKQTWREIHGDVYGAKPNTSGPSGGGIGRQANERGGEECGERLLGQAQGRHDQADPEGRARHRG